ncbi:hypothetical protein J2Y48_004056 [Mycoplana sp. BE70]|nr:hypothetical protein [Mycoplana sp. BE70]
MGYRVYDQFRSRRRHLACLGHFLSETQEPAVGIEHFYDVGIIERDAEFVAERPLELAPQPVVRTELSHGSPLCDPADRNEVGAVV